MIEKTMQKEHLHFKLHKYEYEICVAFLSTFLASWLLGHGVPFKTTFGFSILFVCQCLIGSTIWAWICDHAPRPIFESISMGYVIASTLTVIADQFLIALTNRYELLRFIVVISTILVVVKRQNYQGIQIDSSNICQDFSLMYFVFCFVVIGRTALVFSWLIVFGVCLLMALLFAVNKYSVSDRLILIYSFLSLISFGCILYIWRPSLKYGADLLFPLFSGTDDLIHSEATANSLIHFGPWNSIAAPGYKTSYHWFSLAFSGNIKGILDAEPFVVTLHIAPLIGLLIIGMLMISIVYQISKSYLASIVGLFIAVATTTAPIGARVIQNLNPTNVISYFWSLGAILSCSLFLKKSIRFGIPIITIFASLCLLSKVPHGCILYASIVGMLIFASVSGTLLFRTTVTLFVSLTISYLFTFLFFLKPMPWQDRGFEYPINSAHLAVDSWFYPLIPIGAILVFTFSRFPVFSITLWKNYDEVQRIFVGLTLFGALASLVRFVVLGASSEFYFLNMGLMLSSLGFGCYFGVILEKTPKYFIKILTIEFFVASFSILLILKVVGNRINGVPVLVLPFIGVVFSAVFVLLFSSKIRSMGTLTIILGSLISAGSIGISFGSYLDKAFTVPRAEFTYNVLPLDEIAGFDYLRSVSSFNDVIATNRNLCNEKSQCIQNETHQLISAFTNRIVLIEGPRFLNGARNYPQWAEKRINLSMEFATDPTEATKKLLLDMKVKWYYLVKSTKTDGNAIRSLSKLVFENATIAIYDLSPQS